MLYAALTLQRKFTIDDIKQFRQWGSITPGHPERDLAHGIENSSGPLGQGHAYAAGAAIAEKFLEARLGHTMMQHKYMLTSLMVEYKKASVAKSEDWQET